MHNLFRNAITALITPFNNAAIDYTALEKLIAYQAENGIKNIVVAGSTGEASALSYEEYMQLSKNATEIAHNNGIKITIGVGFNATSQALHAISDLNEIKPDGIMCTTPAYNRPTQEGLFEHFKILHNTSNMPIMLYSVPSRTGIDFTDDTILRLAALPNIVALKDAGSDIERTLRLSQSTDLQLLSGEDSLVLASLSLGGNGVVSVLSNIAPKQVNEIINLFKANKYQEALHLQHKMLELTYLLFAESNPIGVKCAAHILGLCENQLRMPLMPATKELYSKIEQQISQLF